MAKISKREKENKSKVEAQKFYALNEAVELVKALANAKFNESVDIAVQLGIDPRKSDQAVRGSVVMPAGTGKTFLSNCIADALIRQGFREFIPETTKIIIAQRITSVEQADQIVVLDDGKIAGQGTHEELLANNTIYQEIYQSQQEGVQE